MKLFIDLIKKFQFHPSLILYIYIYIYIYISNLVQILLIAICFVFNHFLNLISFSISFLNF